jgi:hypothetical protein
VAVEVKAGAEETLAVAAGALAVPKVGPVVVVKGVVNLVDGQALQATHRAAGEAMRLLRVSNIWR